MNEEVTTTHELATECIYIALLQLMETKLYKDISITDIVKRAGVSRMAYYRNYNSKDEILTKRLERILDKFRVEAYEKQEITEKKFWSDFFESFHKDPVIRNIVKAGLIDQLFNYHKKFTIDIYTNVFGWDLQDENMLRKIYYDMGEIVGLMLFCMDQGDSTDTDKIADLIIANTKIEK